VGHRAYIIYPYDEKGKGEVWKRYYTHNGALIAYEQQRFLTEVYDGRSDRIIIPWPIRLCHGNNDLSEQKHSNTFHHALTESMGDEVLWVGFKGNEGLTRFEELFVSTEEWDKNKIPYAQFSRGSYDVCFPQKMIWSFQVGDVLIVSELVKDLLKEHQDDTAQAIAKILANAIKTYLQTLSHEFVYLPRAKTYDEVDAISQKSDATYSYEQEWPDYTKKENQTRLPKYSKGASVLDLFNAGCDEIDRRIIERTEAKMYALFREYKIANELDYMIERTAPYSPVKWVQGTYIDGGSINHEKMFRIFDEGSMEEYNLEYPDPQKVMTHTGQNLRETLLNDVISDISLDPATESTPKVRVRRRVK
jgi:hypothetical protein